MSGSDPSLPTGMWPTAFFDADMAGIPDTTPITLLPLRVETRFVTQQTDPTTGLLEEIAPIRDADVLDDIVRGAPKDDAAVIAAALALADRTAPRTLDTAAKRSQRTSDEPAALEKAIRAEAAQTEKAARQAATLLGRKWRSMGTKERYLGRKLAAYSRAHAEKEAVTTRYTAQKTRTMDKKIAALRSAFDAPVPAPHAGTAKLVARAGAVVDAFDALNRTVYRAKNIHGPEYAAVRAAQDALVAESGRVRAAVRAGLDARYKTRDVAVSVQRVKDMDRYLRRYRERVALVAPAALAAWDAHGQATAQTIQHTQKRQSVFQKRADALRARAAQAARIAATPEDALDARFSRALDTLQTTALRLARPERVRRPHADAQAELDRLLNALPKTLATLETAYKTPAAALDALSACTAFLTRLDACLEAPGVRAGMRAAVVAHPAFAHVLDSSWHAAWCARARKNMDHGDLAARAKAAHDAWDSLAATCVKAAAAEPAQLPAALSELVDAKATAAYTRAATESAARHVAQRAALKHATQEASSKGAPHRAARSKSAAQNGQNGQNTQDGPEGQAAPENLAPAAPTETELWIRVYPDTVGIQAHTPGLSPAELEAGRVFVARQHYAQSLEERRGAWRLLAMRFGTPRATWIAKQCMPAGYTVPPLSAAEPFVDPAAHALWHAVEAAGADRAAIAAAWANYAASGDKKAVPKAINARPDGLGERMATRLSALGWPLGQSVAGPSGPPAPSALFPPPVTMPEMRDAADHVTPTAVLPHRLAFRVHAYTEEETADGLTWRKAPAGSSTVLGEYWGADIPPDLHAGLSATDPSNPLVVDDAYVGPAGMRWMVDFPDAVQKGMAIRIPLSGAAQTCFASGCAFAVEVVGARQADPGELHALFEGHAAHTGLALLAPGTATNNADAAGSAWRGDADDALVEQAYDALIAPALTPEHDGRAWADLLGLPAEVAQTLVGADAAEQAHERVVHRALFPATLGHFMAEALYQDDQPFLTPAHIAQTGALCADAVRAGGPAPAMRVGAQPYGVLPAMNMFAPALPEDTDGPTFDGRVYGVLRSLWRPWGAFADEAAMHNTRGPWRDLVARAVRPLHAPLGPGESPEQRFLGLLGQTAISAELRHRYGLMLPDDASRGSHGAAAYLSFLQALNLPTADLATSMKFFEPTLHIQGGGCVARVLGVLDGPDLGWFPQPLGHGSTIRASMVVNDLTWFRSHGHITAIAPDAPGQFAAVAHRSPDVVFDPAAAPVHGALAVLLAQKALQSGYWAAAAADWTARTDAWPLVPALYRQYKDQHGTKPTYWIRGDGPAHSAAATRLNFLDADNTPYVPSATPANDPLPTRTRDALFAASNQSPAPGTPGAILRDARDAIAALDAVPPGVLDRLVRGHLDITAHRLDAWFTALATRRLRAQQGTAHAVGAYGFVEDLIPGGARRTAAGTPATTRIDAHGKVVADVATDADNHGFIHAPSLAHATTAAVLRAASAGRGGHAAKVNLSSARVRMAEAILTGVRAGQSLGELLGMRFEQDLHDRAPALGRIRGALRRAFPEATQIHAAPGAQSAADPATQHVVDGLALLRAHERGQAVTPAGLTAAERTAFDASLDVLKNAVDAVGDLVLAEATLHATQGNFDRAAAVLRVLSDGDAAPTLELPRAPRRSFPLEHRVGALLTAEAAPAGADPYTVAEPTLAAWVARVLPALDTVYCQTTVRTGDTVVSTTALTLADLGLSPIAVLYMAGGSGLGPGTPLGRAIAHAALARAPWVMPAPVLVKDPTTATVGQLDGSLDRDGDETAFAAANPYSAQFDPHARDATWPAEALSLGDAMPLLDAVYRMVTHARAMTARDLATAAATASMPQDAATAVDVTELTTRVTAARTAYAQVLHGLQTAPSVAGLDAAAAWGVFEARGTQPAAFSGAASYARRIAETLAPVMAQRLATCDTHLQNAANTDAARVRALQQALQALLGKNVKVLPRFTPHDAPTLHSALNTEVSIPGGPAMGVPRWLQGAALVREGLVPLERAQLLGGLVTGDMDDVLDVHVAQLPAAPGQPWLGLEYPTGLQLTGDVLSLVLHKSPGLDVRHGACAGLVFDQWTEHLPVSTAEPTGLAIHYDTPGAEAPQAVLVAVHSGQTITGQDPGTWNHEELFGLLTSTRELARLRAVEPDHMLPRASAAGGYEVPPLFFGAPFAFDRLPTSPAARAAGALWEMGTDFGPASDSPAVGV